MWLYTGGRGGPMNPVGGHEAIGPPTGIGEVTCRLTLCWHTLALLCYGHWPYHGETGLSVCPRDGPFSSLMAFFLHRLFVCKSRAAALPCSLLFLGIFGMGRAPACGQGNFLPVLLCMLVALACQADPDTTECIRTHPSQYHVYPFLLGGSAVCILQ